MCVYNPQKLVKPHFKLQISLTSGPFSPNLINILSILEEQRI